MSKAPKIWSENIIFEGMDNIKSFTILLIHLSLCIYFYNIVFFLIEENTK